MVNLEGIHEGRRVTRVSLVYLLVCTRPGSMASALLPWRVCVPGKMCVMLARLRQWRDVCGEGVAVLCLGNLFVDGIACAWK